MEDMHETRAAALDLDTLKSRAARCVCKYCGSPLKVERIMYHNCEAARSELFCPKCGRIEFGVEREVYLAAKYYVDTFRFNLYPGLEDNAQRQRMNVAKVCEIMDWQNNKLGIADADGFKVALAVQPDTLGRTSIFRASDLDDPVEGA